MRNIFRGWRSVFRFTFGRTVSAKGFRNTTIGIGIFLVLLCGGLNILFAYIQKPENAKEQISNVTVVNQSGVPVVYDGFAAFNEDYAGITWKEEKEGNAKEIAAKVKDEKALVISIAKNKETYEIQIILPAACTLDSDTLDNLQSDFEDYFDKFRIAASGADEQVVQALTATTNYSLKQVGEKDGSMGSVLLKMLAPMVICLLLYFLILTYGQAIGKSVISEKASKIMELLLTSLKPEGLILGKILGICISAVMQIAIWLFSGIAGFLIGDMFAKQIYPDYSNTVIALFGLISDSGAAGSAARVIFAVVLIILGFVFFCVLAGLVSAGISKPEELSSKMGIFNMVTVFSFLAVYLIPMQNSDKVVLRILNYIPFTGAFSLGSDLLVGKITPIQTILPIVIMLICSAVMVIATGRIYKKKIF